MNLKKKNKQSIISFLLKGIQKKGHDIVAKNLVLKSFNNVLKIKHYSDFYTLLENKFKNIILPFKPKKINNKNNENEYIVTYKAIAYIINSLLKNVKRKKNKLPKSFYLDFVNKIDQFLYNTVNILSNIKKNNIKLYNKNYLYMKKNKTMGKYTNIKNILSKKKYNKTQFTYFYCNK